MPRVPVGAPGSIAAHLPRGQLPWWRRLAVAISPEVASFGAMRLTGSAAFDLGLLSDRDLSIRVLRWAVELGVNHVDTAAFYFSALRSANELINRALSP